MRAVEIKPGIYWVGAIDWSLRNFHGYTTHRGSTYNAYLIVDEKITLIDAVKAPFSQELLARITSVVDPTKIDYIISNHVEMDHTGALPELLKAAPNATVITSKPSGERGLNAHFGKVPCQAVTSGTTLSLGKHTLQFIATPMVHWPDNMVTYCVEEGILFSNDAFGQHYASGTRFFDTEPAEDVLHEARKYYANIVLPYGQQVQKALDMLGGLKLETIAPSHGVIWRGEDIGKIVGLYGDWSQNRSRNRAVVVFDSMWHSTEKIAQTITEAFIQCGIAVKMYDLKVSDNSDILNDLLDATYICVGSPTINNSMMPTVSAFLTYLSGLAPKNRKAMAFGSYGWGGQSVGKVEEILSSSGFEIFMPKVRVPYIPSPDQLLKIEQQLIESIGG